MAREIAVEDAQPVCRGLTVWLRQVCRASIGLALLTLAAGCLLESPNNARSSPSPTETPPQTYSPSELATAFGDAVYRVEVEGCGFLPGSGTAFAVGAHHLITNWHVVAIDSEVTLVTRAGSEIHATVVSADEEADIAVLRADESLPSTLNLARSRDVSEGQSLTVMGYPAPNTDFSVTSGTVTSIDGEGNISTDAEIDQGNSGGPGLNERGEVAGVAFAVTTTNIRAIGLLLPADSAAVQLKAALRGKGTYDVIACAELERRVKEFLEELGPYFREPPTPPPAPGQSF